MAGGTVTIDTESDPGAWALHIAHTPALRLQCPDEFPRAPSVRTDCARYAARSVTQTGGTGEAVLPSPAAPRFASPAPHTNGGAHA